MEYITLFCSALIAATLLPMGSEALLLLLHHQGLPAGWLLFAASSGNILGSCINYGLGHWARNYIESKYQAKRSWQSASNWFQKYGRWSLLFAWLPVVGDPLTLIAGISRINFWVFLLLVSIGKTSRYGVLLYFSTNAFQ